MTRLKEVHKLVSELNLVIANICDELEKLRNIRDQLEALEKIIQSDAKHAVH